MICQRVVLPSRGTLTDWRNELSYWELHSVQQEEVQSPKPRRKEPIHQYMLEANQRKSSFTLLLILLTVIFDISEQECLVNFRCTKSETCIEF